MRGRSMRPNRETGPPINVVLDRDSRERRCGVVGLLQLDAEYIQQASELTGMSRGKTNVERRFRKRISETNRLDKSPKGRFRTVDGT